MKGHGSNSRYRLKTKTVHGVRTGEHNNPHVMKAAARADGGMCDGTTKKGHLGKMGRMRKKEDGGTVSESASVRQRADEAASERNSRLSSTLGSLGAAAALSTAGPLGRFGKALRNLNLGFGATSGAGSAMSEGRRRSLLEEADRLEREGRKDGGGVKAAKFMKAELDEHAEEHKLLAARKKD